MLIRFKSEVGGFVMFGDMAVKLLHMAGHSGTVPGAIAAEDMAAALVRLEEHVLAQAPSAKEVSGSDNPDEHNNDHDNDGEPEVSMAQRVFPLVELMRHAVAEGCAIQWREE